MTTKTNNEKKIKSKEEVLYNAKELFDIISKIIKAFEDGIFPLSKENLHKEQAEEKEKEEIIPDWVKVGNHAFKRIKERADNYINKGWHSKLDGKSTAVAPVKNFLQNIVNGKFNNAKEARNVNNVVCE